MDTVLKQNTVQLKDTVKSRKPLSEKSSTQRFLPIAEIRDNTVVLKNGGLRAVLQTSSVNFNLKSESEQNALVAGYQSFLNSLEFPVQILIRSKKLDIDQYLDGLETLADHQSNPLLEKQTREYHAYIQKLVEYTDIMEKRFYVVVPMDAPSGTKVGFIDRLLRHLRPDDSVSKLKTRRKQFKDLRKKLTQRVGTVTQGLGSCNLRIKELNTAELIELYYHSYNPITAKEQKVQDLNKTNIDQM